MGDCRPDLNAMSDDKAKPAEAPVSVYPHSKVRDDMPDEQWHRIRDQEERERKGQPQCM
jgi:hypothetical protein